jgi:tRNA dimethylallyltransferase
MESKNLDLPIVVITGPTASGKTSLAVDVAEVFGGEIICADSRTVYKYMDIGTAKPSAEDQARVPHWGVDLVEPNEAYSVAQFKEYALSKIDDIRTRNKIPFLVGGTGLYIDAIIFDYKFGDRADEKLRQLLSKMSLEQLHEYCNNNNISLPENYKNKRYVIRAIELNGKSQQRLDMPIDNSIIVGITTERDQLRARIGLRIEQMFEDNVVNEAKWLGENYGWELESMKGDIYPVIHKHLLGTLSIAEAKEKLKTIDWRLAKRQLTWMRRNNFIKWGTVEESRLYLMRQLAKCGRS